MFEEDLYRAIGETLEEGGSQKSLLRKIPRSTNSRDISQKVKIWTVYKSLYDEILLRDRKVCLTKKGRDHFLTIKAPQLGYMRETTIPEVLVPCFRRRIDDRK